MLGAAKVFRSLMDAGAKKILITSDEVGPMGGGDIVYARAHYCFYKADGSVFDQGKYVQARRTFCICVGAMTTNLSFQFNQNTIQ